MTTRIYRNLALSALFMAALPMSALAQQVIATPDAPATAVAGETFIGAGVEYTNDTGAEQTDVVINISALPAGVTWDEAGCIGPAFDLTDINSGTVTIATVGDTVTVGFACPLIVASSAAEGAFVIDAITQEVVGSSAAITIERQFDLALSVIDDPDPVLAGSGTGNLTHTFTLSRSGPSDADGVTVDIAPTLPAGVTPESFDPSEGVMNGLVWEVAPSWPASDNGIDQTLVITLTVDATAASCTDCVSAEGTASATSGTDTDPNNNVAVDPTSIEVAADLVTSFATSVSFTNGDTDSVTATLTCNSGLPLQQSFEISEGSPVNFVVTDLPFTTPGTSCEITIDGVDTAYSVEGSANGGAAAASCVYEVGGFANDGANDCVFTATPMPTTITVESTFIGAEDPSIDTTFETTLTCTNVSPDTGSSFITADTSSGVSPLVVDWYAAPGETASCTAVMVPESSAVEGSECAFTFVLGDEEAGCDVVGTVFFEGIPTLSQYGLAIMALLMLGVGFVGMRRFV